MRKSVFGGDGIATYVTVLVLVVSVLLNVLLAGRAAKTGQADVVRADTIVVRDTVRIVEARVVKEEVVRYDTVYLQSTDTIVNMDSIGVMVPVTERTYEDSTYKAVVRGYNPELVSLDIYRQQTTVYRQQTRKPKVVVSAGVYGGFGAKGADYGLGISVGVPIWSW